MKLSVAIFPLAILVNGCVTNHVMYPDVSLPPVKEIQHQGEIPVKPTTQEPADSVKPKDKENRVDKAKEIAGQAIDAAVGLYEEARDSELIQDAKETAKKAGKYLHDKAVEYHEVVKNAAK